jgi:hypothetical protein
LKSSIGYWRSSENPCLVGMVSDPGKEQKAPKEDRDRCASSLLRSRAVVLNRARG